MELFWKNTHTSDHNDGLDLDSVWGEPDVFDEETLRLAVLFRIALWAMEKGSSMDVIAGFTVDNDGDEILIPTVDEGGDWKWLEQVVNLFVYVKTKSNHEANYYLALIKDSHWDGFDWDNFSSSDDRYEREWDGDYEEFAKQYMESADQELLEALEGYFDYDQYGRDLVDEHYEVIEFGGDEFLVRLY